MPLTDIVRYLNSRDRDQRPFNHLDDPFVATRRGAVARYARITLSTRYAPIYSTASGSLRGHAAVLDAHGDLNDLPLLQDSVFAIPSSGAEYVHLDRLVRTLHALNYLLHPEQRHLFVKVNLRHIENVPSGHGIVFENALRVCGLAPSSITLEIHVEGKPTAALHAALDAYRARGYRIALARPGHDWRDVDWLLPLRPDFVRLDAALLREPDALHTLALRLRNRGIQTLIEADGAAQSERAAASAIDLVQHPAITENDYAEHPHAHAATTDAQAALRE